jgi:hypothetical protein
MQSVYLSAGKTLCRFCGERVSTNQLSIHIARQHPPRQTDVAPTLVRRKEAVPPSHPAVIDNDK